MFFESKRKFGNDLSGTFHTSGKHSPDDGMIAMPIANPAISIEVHPFEEKPGFFHCQVVSMSGEPYGKGKQTYRIYAGDVVFQDVLTYADKVVSASKTWTNAFWLNFA